MGLGVIQHTVPRFGDGCMHSHARPDIPAHSGQVVLQHACAAAVHLVHGVHSPCMVCGPPLATLSQETGVCAGSAAAAALAAICCAFFCCAFATQLMHGRCRAAAHLAGLGALPCCF